MMIHKKWNFLDFVFFFFSTITDKLQKTVNFCWKSKLLINNIKGEKNLLIILTWYDEFLNKKVFERTKKFLDNDIDVCVITPWKICDDIYLYCENMGWSYLYTKQNKLAYAQNIVIQLHDKAQYIYKIDWDIFITKGFFRNLKKKYELALKNSEFIPWAIAPVININWWTYSYFLDKIGKKKEFIEKFKSLKQNVCEEWDNIWYSWEVAEYIRKNTFNIDNLQEKIFSKIDISKEYLANSVRFSIGCFMFTREIWQNLRGGALNNNILEQCELKRYNF